MPRDKNATLSKTCLICRQKLTNQLKFNSSRTYETGGGSDEEGPDKAPQAPATTATPSSSSSSARCGGDGVSNWRALCLETFSMLFGFPAGHPFISIFAPDPSSSACSDNRGKLCNRCVQDLSNVQFTFWQLQSLERKLSELQQLVFERLRSNYEALPVGLIFGKYVGVEELRGNLHNFKFDEIVKILFEEVKSHKDHWPKPSLTQRWTEACQSSERISRFISEHERNRKEEKPSPFPDTLLPHFMDSSEVKIEVDPAIMYAEEDEVIEEEHGSKIPPARNPPSKRVPKKSSRFKIEVEEEDDENDASPEYTPGDEEDDDEEWNKKKCRRGRKKVNAPIPSQSKRGRKPRVLKPVEKPKTKKVLENARFLCTEDPDNCSRTYGSKKHLRDHIEKFHKGQRFPCEEDGCSSTFKSPSSLTTHREKVHLRERPKEICELCGHKCDHKEMRKHFYLKHHGVGKFKCELCSMDFLEESDFTAHSHLHTTAEYPFLCVLCSQLFTNSMDLKSHVASNHLRSGLKCNICGLMKPNDFLLQRHLKIHDRVKTFICGVCGKAFSTQAYLRYHEDHYHTNSTRRFPCEVCGKEFKHEKNVMRHLVSHQEEKPFKCKICPKTFNYSHLLKKHEEIHSGTKNYECHLCGKRFKQEQNLKQHMKSHRPKPERRKRAVKLEDEEEQVEEISYEIHQDEGDKDAIPVILQVQGDLGGMSGHHHHHPQAQVEENVIEATIIPAGEIGEDESGIPTGQFETVQEIQLHHSEDLSQSQTATVVFLYEYNG